MTEVDLSREARVRAMYSQIRYPGLDPESNARYARHRRFVYARLGLDPDTFFKGKVVLDAGCGTGEETLFMAGLGVEKIIGIDTSEGSLEVARAAAERAGITRVEFRRASVLDERVFADASFDYVSSLGCIHHTPDMGRAFANLCRMVRPGGYLATFIYNSFGHFRYNLECDLLDFLVGDEVDRRVRWGRRLFDWRRGPTFEREGVPAANAGRLYDKYGVLYRESLPLKTLLAWYERRGFAHAGSFPMSLKDMVQAAMARRGREGGNWRERLAATLDGLLPEGGRQRQWTWARRCRMQALLLAIGLWDYGSAFRVVGRKE